MWKKIIFYKTSYNQQHKHELYHYRYFGNLSSSQSLAYLWFYLVIAGIVGLALCMKKRSKEQENVKLIDDKTTNSNAEIELTGDRYVQLWSEYPYNPKHNKIHKISCIKHIKYFFISLSIKNAFYFQYLSVYEKASLMVKNHCTFYIQNICSTKKSCCCVC